MRLNANISRLFFIFHICATFSLNEIQSLQIETLDVHVTNDYVLQFSMKQLLIGLHYCHINQVLHRDIKGKFHILSICSFLSSFHYGMCLLKQTFENDILCFKQDLIH